MQPRGNTGPQPLLTPTRWQRDGTGVPSCAGDFDQDGADGPHRALADTPADGPRLVPVDLAGIDPGGSAGVHVLLRTRQGAEAAGAGPEPSAPGDRAARLFELTGAATAFTTHPAQHDALGPGG
ncbi:STAS domain-containing protein [Kitasatospora sp. RB6PN24]|uniref:STAS domain-containing protein n=1 Tax=Kitasatospora humi TaxID=2893891 RepID=UPI001E4621EF|nr:STAS domain-containing protein [Kitasatospora humi]MCC9307911.1 STAS domain-containing protein [Kitasatospora humi]